MTLKLEQFRLELYDLLPYRPDALLDLIDALASNRFARSVIELSLSVLFRRGHSSLPDAIDNFFQAAGSETAAAERQSWEQELMRLIGTYLPPPQARPFWLWGIDVTPLPRQFARTLADRSYVYQPNTLKGNKPVTIGHQASVLAHLPEKEAGAPPWLIPFIISRVGSQQTKNEAGVAQVKQLVSDETLPFAGELNGVVGDSDYACAQLLDLALERAARDNITAIVIRAELDDTAIRTQVNTNAGEPAGDPTDHDPTMLDNSQPKS